MRKEFGDWLRDKIRDSGKTQKEFADIVGIEQPHLSRILSGTRGASNLILQNIALALGVSENIVFEKAGVISKSITSQNEKLDEALHLLSMLEGDDLEELIQIARLKLDRRKSPPTIKPHQSRRKPAQTVLKDNIEH